VAGGGAYVAMQPKPAAPVAGKVVSALTITVAPVQNGFVPRTLMITGSLAAFDELPIGTETEGLAISEVLVDIGDHVKQGQVLVRFNNSVLKAQLQQSQASLNEAEANAVEARANWKRADELVKSGWMSGQDHDNRRAVAATMEARVGVAQANVALAEAKLRQAEIRAPSDGTISSRTARVGAVQTAGGAELFRMIRNDRIELVAELPEADLALVKAGQSITLHVDGAADPAATAKGTVRLIEPTVDQKTRIGRVRIDVERNASTLPGMFVSGLVTLGQTAALVVPEKSVIYQNGEPRLMVIDGNSNVDSRAVTVGPRGSNTIAILSGVTAGERVALRGATYLKSGDHVTIVDNDAAANTAVSSDKK
ncbi:MAG TPA: efflux RND transporter periplasmic adaptor subunit, partial [Magnetospirillaceae bacterium]|nr:efflux RND transporter periplasmic adaptor subunit [Magnetospirillaceae bacterium]